MLRDSVCALSQRIAAIRMLTDGREYEDFRRDVLRYRVVAYNLEHIGKIIKSLPEQTRASYDATASDEIVGLSELLSGHLVTHGHIVWEAARRLVPVLALTIPELRSPPHPALLHA